MKALLIIDMQNASINPGKKTFDADGVIERINMLADHFRTHHMPVIFIQHDGSKENCYIPGTEDWLILSSLNRQSDDIVISKTANDSFYRSDLEKILAQYNVSEVVITGYATDFCVDTTIRSALNKDFKVTVVKDGHTTTSRSFIDAELIMRHHNHVWENMEPTKYRIEVVPANNLLI